MKSSCLNKRLILIGLYSLIIMTRIWAQDSGSAINIVFIGDSITQGVGVSDPATQAAPVIAVHQLQRQIRDDTMVYFSNQGHSGHTTVDFLPGGGDFQQVENASHDLLDKHPGQLVFSIMLGTNDSANSGPAGSPVSADNYAKNLGQIINKLMAEFPGSKFIINHPIWYSPNTHNSSDYEGDSAAERLKSYFPAIDSLVADYAASKHPGQVFVGDEQGYDYFAAHADELNGENGRNGIFHLHPNVTGAQSLGGFWSAALADKLQL